MATVVKGGRKRSAGSTPRASGSQDQHFLESCEKAGVQPTARQLSKWRNNYGAAARAAGNSTRKDPTKRVVNVQG
jgi:hypothetical protein